MKGSDMRVSTIATIAAIGLGSPGMTQNAAPALTGRAHDLIAVLNGKIEPDELFAPSFLAQVPAAQVKTIAGQLSAGLGQALTVASLTQTGPNSARLTITYEHGQVDMNLQLDAAAPNQIVGLLITGTSAGEQTPEQIIAALGALPGKTGFAIAKLGDGAPQMLAGSSVDRSLAIGSAFKLVILAELVREANAGERKWSDIVTLDGRELPGGIYTQMPAGTKVTLLELAQKMISISDNSATDILLTTLGRAKIEAMLPVVGVSDPARNRPYLSTLEMFKIKGTPGGRFSRPWPKLDEAGRRALLKQIDATPISALDPQLFKDGKPILIETAEWFFSPADLVRILDWLRKHSESGPGAEARPILGINPGVGRNASNAQWSYIGYKGGSEPGVIAMAFLLQGKDGWYAITSGWNNPAAAVEDARFAGLMASAVNSVAK
jgi:beta-lactamase class A